MLPAVLSLQRINTPGEMLSKQGGRKSGVAGTRQYTPSRAGGALRVTEHLGVGSGAVQRKPILVAVLVMEGEAVKLAVLYLSPAL